MRREDTIRITSIQAEFRKKYPNIAVRKELLAIVGTEKRRSPSKDHDLARRIVAERYE